jgi:hypothetical protein
MMETNYDSIGEVVASLRKPRECEEPEIQDELVKSVANLKIMFDYGWPFQDIMTTDKGELSGIPIELAQILLLVFEFAARHRIDLVDALAQLKS